jgi:hypothetical protein
LNFVQVEPIAVLGNSVYEKFKIKVQVSTVRDSGRTFKLTRTLNPTTNTTYYQENGNLDEDVDISFT